MKCNFCGSETTRLDSHHLIPRYLSGNETDVIEVDQKCHNTLESVFRNFLKYGQFTPIPWHDYETTKAECCQHCGKKSVRFSSHHLIPRYLDDSNEDLMELCDSCHQKFERIFWNFIVWGSLKTNKWQNYEKQLKRNREYQKNHLLERSRYLKEYRTKNPKKIKRWKAKNYLNHLTEYRLKNNERQKQWRKTHSEEAKKRDKLHYLKIRDRKLAYMKERYKRRIKNENTLLVT
jgi:hypothetical protein